MKPYFYIYRVGYGKPTIKHQTLALAHAEAMRLAGQHPGETFEILECLGIVQTTTPRAFWMDGVTPPETGPMTNREKGMICGECNGDGYVVKIVRGPESRAGVAEDCECQSSQNARALAQQGAQDSPNTTNDI